MISIGINGLGRIGKCIFIQLIHHKFIKIKAINIPNFNINNLEFYLRNDSNHKIWIFFIMLAVVTYVGVSVYASSRIREKYCNKLLSSDIQKLLKKSGCK